MRGISYGIGTGYRGRVLRRKTPSLVRLSDSDPLLPGASLPQDLALIVQLEVWTDQIECRALTESKYTNLPRSGYYLPNKGE